MRVLVSTNAMFGHFDPLVPLSLALVAAGHEVVVATEPGFGEVVRSRGLGFVAVGRDLTDDDLFAVIPDIFEVAPEDQHAYAAPRVFIELRASNVVDDLAQVVSTWKPDLIVRESGAFAAWAIAEARSIPHVVLSLGSDTSAAEWDAMAGSFFRTLGECVGVSGLDGSSLCRHGLLAFEPAGYNDWTATPTASVFRPPITSGDAFRHAFPGSVDRPLIYVTLGTEFQNAELMATMIGALADGDWNVVVATGPRGNPAEIDPGRHNVIVQHWVPQDAVLNEAAVVVTHAGAGTTIGALIRGVPLVCVPQGADQFHHARRVAELGAGIDLPADRRSRADILDAIVDVLTLGSYRDCVEQLAFDTTRLPDVGAAVSLLEGLAG